MHELCADVPRYCKEGFLIPNQNLSLQRLFWNAFQVNETPCHTQGLREKEAGPCCLLHNDMRIRCGKEARIAFLSKEALGMWSVVRDECMEQPGACNLLFLELFLMASALFVQSRPVLFSLLVQTRHGHAQSAIS